MVILILSFSAQSYVFIKKTGHSPCLATSLRSTLSSFSDHSFRGFNSRILSIFTTAPDVFYNRQIILRSLMMAKCHTFIVFPVVWEGWKHRSWPSYRSMGVLYYKTMWLFFRFAASIYTIAPDYWSWIVPIFSFETETGVYPCRHPHP